METIIGGGIAALTMYAAQKWRKTDQEKIQHTFYNIGYKIDDKGPVLFKKYKAKTYTLYTYHVPFGLVDDDKLEVLEKVLNRPVDISFAKQKLHIKVYRENLKEHYEYSLFPNKSNWSIPIGMSYDGAIYHDFNTIPHMTVAGSTTWGKTVFMRMLMTHLVENNPDGVEFYILDLKGKLAFNKYRNLRQVQSVSGSYKECHKALSEVKKSIDNDMEYLLSVDAENAKEGQLQTRKFIIIDEAGELQPKKSMTDEQKEDVNGCQQILSHIARVAGQVGYKLIFGTQYPTAEILDSQIKANAVAKISFRLSTSVQSGVAIDQKGAEKLEYPGRAIYRTFDDRLVQTPFISRSEIWERIGRYEDVSPAAEERAEAREHTFEFG